MPTSTFTTVDDLSEQLGKGVHNWAAHTLKLALTNSAPLASNTVLADITQISASAGDVADTETLTVDLGATGILQVTS
jgi:hypothetical protein